MNEITSNESTSLLFAIKVLTFYNMLRGALTSYCINLKHFKNFDVPSKVKDLFRFCRTINNICTEKLLFDEDDYIVKVSWFRDHN